ncbi:DUF5719 family protein [Flexivirga meconopsidis]|uniref:DUF5719 family protein n=1 Tax=Flexivirga meconopsidis TaxID=2977121 RepID=UPI00223F9EE0|nr:DUF5719 family protein [Flexivirga meconopsidis]
MRVSGMVRAVVAVAVGGGLVWGAGEATGTVDVTKGSDVRELNADSTSGALQQARLTCTGPDRAGAAGSVGAKQAVSVNGASAPTALLSGAGSDGSVTLGGSGAKTTDFAIQRGGVGSAKVAGDVAPQLDVRDGLAPGFTASQGGLVDDASGRGLTLSSCGAPVRDGWFFGGGADKGRVARLVLVNPGATPATVDAAVLGASGADANKSVKGLVLAPGERKVIVLGAFPRSLANAAVHVTATGGGVVATLTDAWMDGETPVGEATSNATAAPAKDLVIAGVAASDAAPEVRVAVPGPDDAIVRVRAIDDSGAVAADKVRTVSAGTTDAVTLSGLRPGKYQLRVTSDVPVAAAALGRTAASGRTDIAWAPAATAITGLTGAALPTAVPGGRATLMVSSPKGGAVDVETVTDKGSSRSRITVRSDRPVVQQLPASVRAVWLRPADDVSAYATVLVDGKDAKGGLSAALPLLPVSTTGTSVSMTPARG